MTDDQRAALYCFAPFEHPASIRDDLLTRLRKRKPSAAPCLIAPEGINGTIAGTAPAVEILLAAIRALPGCEALAVRRSTAATPPFHRLKVRVKREIVTMGQPVDPRTGAGTHVAPADWNALIADPETVVIDTRNDYEVRIGSFAGAIDPGTRGFAEFPAWFRANRERLLAGKTQGRDVLHRRHPLREIDRFPQGRRRRGCLSPARRHPELSRDRSGHRQPLDGRMLRVRRARRGRAPG